MFTLGRFVCMKPLKRGGAKAMVGDMKATRQPALSADIDLAMLLDRSRTLVTTNTRGTVEEGTKKRLQKRVQSTEEKQG